MNRIITAPKGLVKVIPNFKEENYERQYLQSN